MFQHESSSNLFYQLLYAFSPHSVHASRLPFAISTKCRKLPQLPCEAAGEVSESPSCSGAPVTLGLLPVGTFSYSESKKPRQERISFIYNFLNVRVHTTRRVADCKRQELGVRMGFLEQGAAQRLSSQAKRPLSLQILLV